MSKRNDAFVGHLAVMDGVLNYLLREILTEVEAESGNSINVAEDLLQVTESHPELFTTEMTEWLTDAANAARNRTVGGLTTGRAAQALLAHAKRDTELLTPEVAGWLKRVDKAAPKRNTTIHAIAQDQCVICGNATRFTHKGESVDRSAQAVAATVAEFRDLINEGVEHARTISDTLNERAMTAALQEAAATGTVQSPRQVLIGQTLHRCGNCTPGGKAITVVALPPARAALPPES